MQNITCCFAGHSKIYNDSELKDKVYEKCVELITKHGVTEFLVGNYGAFDRLAAGVVRELKKQYPEIKLNLTVPYVTKEMNENREWYYKEYDCILMAEIPENTPIRYRISKCNQYMIDVSQYMIAYVRHHCGGAAKTLEYAKRRDIEIFNFGDEKEQDG